MKKSIYIFLIGFLLLPGSVGAIEFKNPLKYDSFTELAENMANFLFRLGLAVFGLMIIVAAFLLLTSGGEPQKVQTAKNIIMWGFIGVIILFLSIAIVDFLKSMLGVENTNI